MPLFKKLIQWKRKTQSYKQAANLLKSELYKLAAKPLQQILFLDPSDPIANYLLSICYQKQGSAEMAKSLKQRAMLLNGCSDYLNKSETELVQSLSGMVHRLQTFEKRLETLSAKVFMDISQENCKILNFCHAAQIFKVADSVIPEQVRDFHYYSHSGLMYYEQGKYQAAVQRYKIAVMKQSKQFRYYNNLAILGYANGQPQKSLSLIDKALQLKPGYPRSYYILSFCHLKLGNCNQALIAIKFCIQNKPKVLFYQVKYFCTTFLGFKEPIESYQKQIKLIQQMVEKDQDQDKIMLKQFFKPFLTDAIKLLSRYFDNPLNIQNNPLIWRFVRYFDDFLLMGNCHKFNIMKKMQKMMTTVLLQYSKQIQAEEQPTLEALD